jgi:protein-disulfide isomerase
VKRLTFAMLALAFGAVALADEAPAPNLGLAAEKLIQENLPVCSAETTVKSVPLHHTLPGSITGKMVQVESTRQTCNGQWLVATSPQGGFFMGIPWFLDDVKDVPTLEQKLKDFAWKNLQQNFVPVIDRTPTREGLFKVTLNQSTERGTLPLQGEIDPKGTVFFVGHFVPVTEDLRAGRVKSLGSFLTDSPVTGPANAPVTVIEFSDFECPSCMRASGFMKPLLEKYGDKLRYIRYDLPLVQMHPWAFSAALAGRAIYRQKPALFWDYKKQVYENQEKLNAFSIDDFARGFAQDHELDLKKYDADLASPALREELMKGVGAAFANDVRATPTYMINGVFVDAGDGSYLDKYIAGLLKK